MTTDARPLVAGNWKMNGTRADALALARELAARAAGAGALACEILLCPPATLLTVVGAMLDGSAIALGAQDCHPEPGGAHTGDISAEMLANAGCAYVIVGHSERRGDHGESDSLVRAKAEAVHRAGLGAIVCVGETRAERDGGDTLAVVERQLSGSLPPAAHAGDTVIAYEPVWAIGTGLTPTAGEVAEVHAQIRAALGRREVGGAGAFRILYGGSVKSDNAGELLSIEGVDGALVGGASLSVEDFWGIIETYV